MCGDLSVPFLPVSTTSVLALDYQQHSNCWLPALPLSLARCNPPAFVSHMLCCVDCSSVDLIICIVSYSSHIISDCEAKRARRSALWKIEFGIQVLILNGMLPVIVSTAKASKASRRANLELEAQLRVALGGQVCLFHVSISTTCSSS